MHPVNFMFSSTNSCSSEDLYDSCGCQGIADEQFDCNKVDEEEPKINSDIANTGAPYKEIEVTINDNRMVLRIQHLAPPAKEEWEPPCDCVPSSIPQLNEGLPSAPQRIITAAPLPVDHTRTPPKSDNLDSPRPIDLAENPNMFLLKIRKHSETSDRKREHIDLEFRIPRPWMPRPPQKRKKPFREEYEEQKEKQGISEDNAPPPKKKKSKKGKK